MKKLITVILGAAGLIISDTTLTASDLKVASKNPSSAGSPFTGFYLGASLGGVRQKLKVKEESTSPVRLIVPFKKRYNHGFCYGIHTGYGSTFAGNIYLGAELGVNADTLNQYKSHNSYNSTKIKAKYTRSPAFFVAPRLGVIFCDSYMFYIKPGMEISKDQVKFIDDDERSSSKKKVLFSFAPNIGFEKAVDRVLLRAELGYNAGSKSKTKKLNWENEDGYQIQGKKSLKYRSYSFKLGLSYQL